MGQEQEADDDMEGTTHLGNSIEEAEDKPLADFFMGVDAVRRKAVEEFTRLSTYFKSKIKHHTPSDQLEEQYSAQEKPSTCIHICPKSLVPDLNVDKWEEYFHPRIVSIGPYYHGEKELEKMEKHKWRYLSSLLKRTGKGINHYLKHFMDLEDPARSCYADQSKIPHREDFIKILLLDGCFVVELLRKVSDVVKTTEQEDDPLVTMPWMVPFLKKDLFMLQNQLPFFILERVFGLSSISKSEDPPSLAALIHRFLDKAMLKPMKVINVQPHDPKHLLDFIRSSLLPCGNITYRRSSESAGSISHLPTSRRPVLPICWSRGDDQVDLEAPQVGQDHDHQAKKWEDLNWIPCAEELQLVGIKFIAAKEGSNLKFENGELEIPSIDIYHGTASFLLNCIAFEQCCSNCNKGFSDYAMLMDLLINTSRDVAILCDSRIINNHSGSGTDQDELAQFFNSFGKVIAVDIFRKAHIFSELQKIKNYYYNNKTWRELRTSFKDTYFKSPWVFMSAFAALILLLLTVVQTVFAVLGYYRPPF